jgi:polyisoprenoid-binding protein YceI
MTTDLALPQTELSGDYAIDVAHSRVGFVARHAMVTKVRGSFNNFTGQAHLDFAAPEQSTVNLVLEVASIDTRNDQRDEHLRTNDFFDAATYPEITFRSSRIEHRSGDNYRLSGDLTIKDLTRSVDLDIDFQGAVKDPWGNIRVGFEGSTTINRSDFGMAFNVVLEAGGLLVSDKITIEVEISATKVPEADEVARA